MATGMDFDESQLRNILIGQEVLPQVSTLRFQQKGNGIPQRLHCYSQNLSAMDELVIRQIQAVKAGIKMPAASGDSTLTPQKRS